MGRNTLVEVCRETCPYCKEQVNYVWAEGGGVMSSRQYVLIANWIYHSSCWDKQIEENPI